MKFFLHLNKCWKNDLMNESDDWSEQAKIQEYKKELSTDEKNRKNNNDCRLCWLESRKSTTQKLCPETSPYQKSPVMSIENM